MEKSTEVLEVRASKKKPPSVGPTKLIETYKTLRVLQGNYCQPEKQTRKLLAKVLPLKPCGDVFPDVLHADQAPQDTHRESPWT